MSDVMRETALRDRVAEARRLESLVDSMATEVANASLDLDRSQRRLNGARERLADKLSQLAKLAAAEPWPAPSATPGEKP